VRAYETRPKIEDIQSKRR